MPRITLHLKDAEIKSEVSGILTSGMAGVQVNLVCDESWEGLHKTLVCRAGDVAKTVFVKDDSAVVAHETMVAGKWLELGVEGRNEDGSVVIPTLWDRCCIVLPGVDDQADPTVDPTLPIWVQLQKRIEALEIPPVPVEIGALPGPMVAKVGQRFQVAAVNRIGMVVAVEAVDAPVEAIRLAARVVTTEQTTAIEITGLDIRLPASIRIFNTGEKSGSGLVLTVNGVKDLLHGSSGTTTTSGTDYARVRAWLWEEDHKLLGKSGMVNGAVNNYQFGDAPDRVNSIGITSYYNGYYQAGTVVEVYEGVFPNVQ